MNLNWMMNLNNFCKLASFDLFKLYTNFLL
jgi:hypothetical protein